MPIELPQEHILIKSHPTDRRSQKRSPCSIPASINFDDVILGHCAIKDISASGLRLYIPAGTWLPRKFHVKAAFFKRPLKVRTVRVEYEDVGVEFTDPKSSLEFKDWYRPISA